MFNPSDLALQHSKKGTIRVSNAATRIDRRVLSMVLAVAMVTAIVCYPFHNTVFWLGDEGEVLHGVQLMLQGKRLYADFFEVLPPGSFLLTEAWLRSFGDTISSAGALAIFVNVGTAILAFLSCWIVSKRLVLSGAIVTCWVVMTQGMWTQVSHHWVTALFSMALYAGILATPSKSSRKYWLLFSGLAGGMAAMTTPNCGALVLLAGLWAALVVQKTPWKDLLWYFIGSAIVPALIILWLLVEGISLSAFHDVIVWNAMNYSSVQHVRFGTGASLSTLPLALLFPVSLLLYVLVFLRDRRQYIRDDQMASCAAFAVAGFLGCFPRPDMVHIGFAAPLALPLLARTLMKLTERSGQFCRFLPAALVLAASIRPAHSLLRMTDRANEAVQIQTKRGSVALEGALGQELPPLMSFIDAIPPSDKFFFYPYIPLLPYLTGRDQTAKNDIFVPEYTTAGQYRSACLSTLKQANWVVLDRQWTNPSFLKKVLPAMRDASPPEKQEFERIITNSFRTEAVFGSFELRKKVHDTTFQACREIGR